MRRLFAIAIAALLTTSVEAANIEARLIRATNDDLPADERLKDLESKLAPVFGYKSYRQLGQDKKPITQDKPVWLDFGKGFTLQAKHKSSQDKVHALDVELYSGKTVILRTSLKLPEGSPVLIKGPEVGATLMVISLVATE